MHRFPPTPASEKLAAFLQTLAPGAHAAVDLGTLSMDLAVDISRQVASGRKERFVVVAQQGGEGSELAADSLADALPLEKYAATTSKVWVVVDAAASMAAKGVHAHAEAEARLGAQVAARLTVVCFYTAEALAQIKPSELPRLHSLVASLQQV